MNDPCTMYVTGVPVSMNAAGFRNMFGRCGDVISVSILPPKASYNSAVGFADYGSRMEGLKAIRMFDDFKIGDNTLRVSFAKKKIEMSPNLNTGNTKIDLTTIVERNIEQSTKRAAERFKKYETVNDKPVGFPCAFCKKLSQATCVSCKSVHYCGSSCQKEDWPRHKLECEELNQRRTGTGTSKIAEASENNFEDFEVEVGDPLLNQLASRVTNCVDVKKPATNLVSTSHVDIPFPIKVGGHFQVQLIDLSVSGDIFCLVPTDQPSSSALDTLHDYYSNERTAVPSVVEVGRLYASKFSTDKQWYRACVMDMSDDGSMCSVWYVDYGNCEDAETSGLRVLAEKFASIPMRTIKCRLAKCDKIASSCVRDFFMQVLSDPIVEVEVIEICGTVTYVQMYGLISEKLCCINELVMEKCMPAKSTISPTSEEDTKESPKTQETARLEISPQFGAESIRSHCNESPIANSVSTALLQPRPIPMSRSASNPTTASRILHGSKPSIENEPPSKLQSIFNKIRSKSLSSTQAMLLQELEIPKGKFQAVITEVGGIDELYLSLHSDHDRLAYFQSDLKAACDLDFTLQQYKKGAICVYLDEASGIWHRCKIMSKDGVSRILIHLIDSGGKQTVSSLKLGKPPAKERFWVPPKTIPCKLKGCSAGSQEYNTECMDLLKQCKYEQVTAEVTGEFIDGVYPVTIYMEDGVTVNWCIRQLHEEFESEDMATPKPEKPHIAEITNQLDCSAAQHSSSNLKFKNEVEIEEKSDLKGQNEVINALSPPVNATVNVVVVHVVSPSEFYCQVITDELKDVFVQLSKLNNGTVELLKKMDDFKIGQMCIACASDGQLYRAEISSVEQGSCCVLFLDYGNSEVVSHDNIRQIPQVLSKFHAQAVKCRLHDCVPVEDSWSQDCIDAVKELNDQTVNAIFTGRCLDGHHEVKIFLNGKDATSILIDQSMVKKGNEQCLPEKVEVITIGEGKLQNETGSTKASDQLFKVELLMRPPTGTCDTWMTQYAEMVQQFSGKVINAELVRKDNEQPEEWTLVIPNLLTQLAMK